MRNNKKGFTLVELLVVIVIIGLLATMAMLALNSARMKGRDAKRVSDIKQIQTALELYFNGQNAYAPAASGIVLGSASYNHLCDDATGFAASCGSGVTTLMALVPADPDPGNSSSGCGDYTYTAAASSATSYSIVFCLEDDVGDLSDKCTATQSGITCSTA